MRFVKSSRIISCSLVFSLSACGGTDKAPALEGDEGGKVSSAADAGATGEAAPAPPPPAYVFSTSVQDGDGYHIYVRALSKLEGEVTLDKALELPSGTSVFSALGAVFIANPEDLTLTRYELAPEDLLVQSKRLSVAAAGVTGFSTRPFFINAETAYYVDAPSQQIIVWNPSTMEITKVVPLLDLSRNGLEGTLHGYDAPSAWLLKERGILYMPVTWADSDTLKAEKLVALLAISATDPTDQKLYVSDCAAISDEGMLLGADGNIYLAGTNQFTFFRQYGDAPESAIAKFDLETRSFDPGYCQKIPALTGGLEGGTLIAFAPGEFVLRAVDKGLVKFGDTGTFWDDIEYGCRIYYGKIDASGRLEVREEPKLSTAPNYCWGWVYKVDGTPYFWGEDTMFKWDGANMVPMFKAPGVATELERVR
ncbi:MAG: hypothetical protein ABW252_17205 [Polyangiales bacterium]